jgi:hypothetical protein
MPDMYTNACLMLFLLRLSSAILTCMLSAVLSAFIRCHLCWWRATYQVTFFQFHELSRALVVMYVGVVCEYAFAVQRTLKNTLVMSTKM